MSQRSTSHSGGVSRWIKLEKEKRPESSGEKATVNDQVSPLWPEANCYHVRCGTAVWVKADAARESQNRRLLSCRHRDAKVLLDGDLAASRNVLVAVGTGRLNIYDQAPTDSGRGAVHHLGVKVDGLRQLWERLRSAGVASDHGLREHDGWRYVMISAPDGLLVELFEFDDPSRPEAWAQRPS